jgi:hypothetical protein
MAKFMDQHKTDKHSKAPDAYSQKDHHRHAFGRPSNKFLGMIGTGWPLHGWVLRSGNTTAPQLPPTQSLKYSPNRDRPNELDLLISRPS